MLTLISPSKDIKIRSPQSSVALTEPRLLGETKKLVEKMREKSASDIEEMMKVSPAIAKLTVSRFQDFDDDNQSNSSALFTFYGDVYRNLFSDDFSKEEIEFSQENLRIISGLYGILRPLDMIQPYRLEMGRKLATEAGTNLYQFWGTRLGEIIKQDLDTHHLPFVVNLASNEYAKAIKFLDVDIPIIQVQFLNATKTGLRVVGVHAKKTRGLMARWIVKNQIENPYDLHGFNLNGYEFTPSKSNSLLMTFESKD